MDNTNVNKVNNIVERIIRSRYKNVDYSFAYEIAKMIVSNFRRPSGLWQSNGKELSNEETIRITKDFYKLLGSDIYSKVEHIIAGEDEKAKLEIIDESSDFYKEPRAYTDKDGKQRVVIKFNGNTFDVFGLVHELAHTLDMPEGNWNISRICFSEVTSECIEKMFMVYAKENDICPLDDLNGEHNNHAIRMYESAKEYVVKYMFMISKIRNGFLSGQDIDELLRFFNISINNALYILEANNQNVHHSFKYVLAGIASEQFEDIYLSDRNEGIENFRSYIELIKQNKGIDAVKSLGIDISQNGVKEAIRKANTHFYPDFNVGEQR